MRQSLALIQPNGHRARLSNSVKHQIAFTFPAGFTPAGNINYINMETLTHFHLTETNLGKQFLAGPELRSVLLAYGCQFADFVELVALPRPAGLETTTLQAGERVNGRTLASDASFTFVIPAAPLKLQVFQGKRKGVYLTKCISLDLDFPRLLPGRPCKTVRTPEEEKELQEVLAARSLGFL